MEAEYIDIQGRKKVWGGGSGEWISRGGGVSFPTG